MKDYIVTVPDTYYVGYLRQNPELIRCKDCRSWRKSYYDSVDGMVCNKTRFIMKPDDYCSMARAKEIDNAEKS